MGDLQHTPGLIEDQSFQSISAKFCRAGGDFDTLVEDLFDLDPCPLEGLPAAGGGHGDPGRVKKQGGIPTVRKICDFCSSRKKRCDGGGVKRCSHCIAKNNPHCVYSQRRPTRLPARKQYVKANVTANAGAIPAISSPSFKSQELTATTGSGGDHPLARGPMSMPGLPRQGSTMSSDQYREVAMNRPASSASGSGSIGSIIKAASGLGEAEEVVLGEGENGASYAGLEAAMFNDDGDKGSCGSDDDDDLGGRNTAMPSVAETEFGLGAGNFLESACDMAGCGPWDTRMADAGGSMADGQEAGPIVFQTDKRILVECGGCLFLVSAVVDCQPSGSSFGVPLDLDFRVEEGLNEQSDDSEDTSLDEYFDECMEIIRNTYKILQREQSGDPWSCW
eukprot:g15172.t1